MKNRTTGTSERESAVLGLLSERPLYGYTIEKIIEERGMRHWTEIGFSSIYYVLKRLEQQHLITSTSEQPDTRPSRNVYTITDAGRTALTEAVRSFLSQFTPMRSPFSLGIANGTLLSCDEIHTCLAERLRVIDEVILHMQSMRVTKTKERKPFYVIALFDRSLAHLQTEREWVAGFMTELHNHVGDGEIKRGKREDNDAATGSMAQER
ncbi:MAG: PadR family transcriptional regulator [Methanoregula sp.]|nr:PadR family transcriptional regulator [Methanoregula sp.]